MIQQFTPKLFSYIKDQMVGQIDILSAYKMPFPPLVFTATKLTMHKKLTKQIHCTLFIVLLPITQAVSGNVVLCVLLTVK